MKYSLGLSTIYTNVYICIISECLRYQIFRVGKLVFFLFDKISIQMSRNIALTPKASLQIGLVSTACKYQPSAKRIFALFSKWWNDMNMNYDFQQRYLWTSLDTFIDAAQPITKKENWTKGDLRFVELLSERLIRESGRRSQNRQTQYSSNDQNINQMDF